MSRKCLSILLAVLLLPATEAVGLAAPMIKMSVRINPLAIKIKAPRRVEEDRVFEIRARILNSSGRTLRLVGATLIPPKGMVIMQTPARQSLGRIPGGGSKVAAWSVKAKSGGTKVVRVKAAARLSKTGPFFSVSKTASISVRKRLRFLSIYDAIIRFLLGRARPA